MKFPTFTHADGRLMANRLIEGVLTPESFGVIMLGRGTWSEYRHEFLNTLISHARNDPVVKARLAKRKTPVKPVIVFADDTDDENQAD